MVKFSNPGSRMRPIYTAESVSPLRVVKTGEEDQFAFIQASKESVLLDNLIKRALEGEVDVLDQARGMYGDFTEIPDNLADVMQVYERGIEAFERLPKSVTETYGSIGDLLDALASGEFDRNFSSPEARVEKDTESGDANE